MNITLPAPQHVDHVYVHALTHSVLTSAGIVALIVVGFFAITNATFQPRREQLPVMVGIGVLSTAVLSLLAAFITYGVVKSDPVLTQSAWHNTRIDASSLDSVNGATKNQSLNAGLKEHYGLVAADPKVAPLQAPLSEINTEAAHGTSYTLNGQPVTCAISYAVKGTNNVKMPTKIHVDRVVCTGNNGTHIVKGH